MSFTLIKEAAKLKKSASKVIFKRKIIGRKNYVDKKNALLQSRTGGKIIIKLK